MGAIVLKGAAVAEATRAHWHTCSLLLNFTQYLGANGNRFCSRVMFYST